MAFTLVSAVVLVAIMFQNSVALIATRYSRMDVPAAENYNTSSLVLHQELIKLLVCLGIYAYEQYAALARHRQKRAGEDEAAALSTTTEVVMESWSAGGDKTNNATANSSGSSSGAQSRPGNSPCNLNTNPQAGTVDDAPAGSVRLVPFLLRQFPRTLWARLRQPDTLKLLFPASLYLFQNISLYFTLYHLDVVLFQIWSQSRVLLTALLSVVMLHRRFAPAQWGCLVLLTVGVCIAQVGSGDGTPAGGKPAALKDSGAALSTTAAPEKSDRYPLLGVCMCLAASASSSAANVYFELILKDMRASLALRNIQLSLLSLPLLMGYSFVAVVVPAWRRQTELSRVCPPPFAPHYNIFAPAPRYGPDSGLPPACTAPPHALYIWRRFDAPIVWVVILLQSMGGLLVAAVMRYADNVLKNFATCLAVLVSTVLTAIIWNVIPTWVFAIGAAMVLTAAISFGRFERKA